MLAMNNVVKAWTTCVVSDTPELGLKVTRGLHTHKFNDFGIMHKCITKVQKQDDEREWEYKLAHLKIGKIPNPNVKGFQIVTRV